MENRLRQLGITAREAERRGGLHHGFLGDLLRGQKSGLQARNVARLAQAINVAPELIALVMSDMGGTQASGLCSLEGVDPNVGPTPTDSLRSALEHAERDRDRLSLHVELAIGSELKVHASVDSSTLTAILAMLIHRTR